MECKIPYKFFLTRIIIKEVKQISQRFVLKEVIIINITYNIFNIISDGFRSESFVYVFIYY